MTASPSRHKFFGAIDGGIDKRHSETLNMSGPFATISFGRVESIPGPRASSPRRWRSPIQCGLEGRGPGDMAEPLLPDMLVSG